MKDIYKDFSVVAESLEPALFKLLVTLSIGHRLFSVDSVYRFYVVIHNLNDTPEQVSKF